MPIFYTRRFVLRVRLPYERHLRRKPLLKRFRDEAPIFIEPSSERGGQLQSFCFSTFLVRLHRNVVDGTVFGDARSDRKLNGTLACPTSTVQEPPTDQRSIEFASIDLALLNEPYPNREDRVDGEVRDHSPEGGSLGCVPA